MKVSDYLVEFLIERGITDVFGYPGGMVTHLMDSLSNYSGRIQTHITCHEQGAAFAACGYAQAGAPFGVAFATSGPGATNLVTGICNAYFDSVPVLFLTGQVNTTEAKGDLGVRQRGFQETDIVSMVRGVTKAAVSVRSASAFANCLDMAVRTMTEGRKGPVLLDIPMDILRAQIDASPAQNAFAAPFASPPALSQADLDAVREALLQAKRPVVLLGNGIKSAGATAQANALLERLPIPTVSTMLAVDVSQNPRTRFGFIGAYGSRAANFIVAKCDLLLCLGARLDVRQVGANRAAFAPNARLIRVDVDADELGYRVHEDELSLHADLQSALSGLCELAAQEDFHYPDWLAVCETLQKKLAGMDDRLPNAYLERIGRFLPQEAVITTDVGQNQVWVAQSLLPKRGQRFLFSGGHGAMGYALPAAIGAHFASRKPVYCFCGDGGFQMTMQELQTIARERLPITVVLCNNRSLGMIRHFQEMYFGGNAAMTTEGHGYSAADFQKIALAYGFCYAAVSSVDDVSPAMMTSREPMLIEIKLPEQTYVYPKLEFGKPNQDQEPRLDRALYNELMDL